MFFLGVAKIVRLRVEVVKKWLVFVGCQGQYLLPASCGQVTGCGVAGWWPPRWELNPNRGTAEAGFNEALRRCVLVDGPTRDGSVVSTWELWPLVMLK